MKVFFDTNVLVSALTTRGVCAEVVEEALGRCEVVVNEVVLEELRRVLTDRMAVDAERVSRVVAFFARFLTKTELHPPLAFGLSDPADERIVAAAAAAKADLLVTGDREILDAGGSLPVAVETPRQLLLRLRRGTGG